MNDSTKNKTPKFTHAEWMARVCNHILYLNILCVSRRVSLYDTIKYYYYYIWIEIDVGTVFVHNYYKTEREKKTGEYIGLRANVSSLLPSSCLVSCVCATNTAGTTIFTMRPETSCFENSSEKWEEKKQQSMLLLFVIRTISIFFRSNYFITFVNMEKKIFRSIQWRKNGKQII